MEISRPNGATILIARIDPVAAELLRSIAKSADPSDSEAARARLYSLPTVDPQEAGFSEDWREFVQPELAHLFQSARQIIADDLRNLNGDLATGEFTLAIPNDHLESWLHGLNQARLVITERHKLHEDEASESEPLPSTDPRAFMQLQLHFYAQLQWLFLRLLEDH